MRLSILHRCNPTMRTFISLGKCKEYIRTPLTLTQSSLSSRLSLNLTANCFGTTSNNHGYSLLKQNQIKTSYMTQSSSCGCRSSPLCRRIQESLLLRRFKSQTSVENEVGKIALWKRLTFVATVGGVIAYMIYDINRDRAIQDEKVRYEEFQKAQLGGDWTLTDHHGNKRSSTEFRGQWILMYFGFTHCPDICPEELEKLVGIVKAFDDNPKLPSMMPIFITLDPERDTPKAIKEYLADYKCPRMLGFTAPTVEEIKEVATKYRAYFSKGLPDEDNDYIVDHTIIIYLVNPKGEFVNYFDRSRSAERIINTVTDHIHKYNELEAKEIR